MSGIQGCLEKQPAHHESQSEDKKTWSAKKRGYNDKVRFETHNGIPERGLMKC